MFNIAVLAMCLKTLFFGNKAAAYTHIFSCGGAAYISMRLIARFYNKTIVCSLYEWEF